jgi:urease accessory protein
MLMKSREPKPRRRRPPPTRRAEKPNLLVTAKSATQPAKLIRAPADPSSSQNDRPRGAKSHDAITIDAGALYRLMAWLSPAYPIGAFSYSSGIEWAVESGDITNQETLRAWLEVVIGAGAGFCDAVFLVHAHRAIGDGDAPALRRVAELASAFAPSKERCLETTAQGRAFVETTLAAWPTAALGRLLAVWDGAIALPVAVGVACAGHEVPVMPALAGYLQAMTSNLTSAGMRLVPLGQTDGQHVLSALEPVIIETGRRALQSELEDAGACAFRADLASMRHETQHTRLFRS